MRKASNFQTGRQKMETKKGKVVKVRTKVTTGSKWRRGRKPYRAQVLDFSLKSKRSEKGSGRDPERQSVNKGPWQNCSGPLKRTGQ